MFAAYSDWIALASYNGGCSSLFPVQCTLSLALFLSEMAPRLSLCALEVSAKTTAVWFQVEPRPLFPPTRRESSPRAFCPCVSRQDILNYFAQLPPWTFATARQHTHQPDTLTSPHAHSVSLQPSSKKNRTSPFVRRWSQGWEPESCLHSQLSAMLVNASIIH